MEMRRILVRLLSKVELQVVVRTSSSFDAAKDTERMGFFNTDGRRWWLMRLDRSKRSRQW